MARSILLLTLLLPVLFALTQAQLVQRRKVNGVAVPSTRQFKRADFAWLANQKRKIEQRYGGADEDNESEKRWVQIDPNAIKDAAFVAVEDQDDDDQVKDKSILEMAKSMAKQSSSHMLTGDKEQSTDDYKMNKANKSSSSSKSSKTSSKSSSKSSSPSSAKSSSSSSTKSSSPSSSQSSSSNSSSSSTSSSPAAASTGSGSGTKATAIKLDTQLTDDGQEREVLCDITIGSQTFRIDPDTGSSDLWVVSDLCKGECGQSTPYKTNSSSALDAKKNFTIQYGQGATKGKLYRDSVKLSDLSIRNLTIGAASQISADLATDAAAGILGLGFRSLTSAGQKTFLDRLFQQEKSLKDKVVSLAFGRKARNTLDKAELRFGEVNQDLYKGDISYSKVTKQGYWQFGIKSFAASNGTGLNTDAIIDSGTSLIAVSSDDAKKFYKDVDNSKYDDVSGFYTYPCGQKINATLSTNDGRTFTVDDDDFNLGNNGNNRCVGAVFPAQTKNVIVLGLSFLKSAYSVLDYGQNRVGLADYSF
ncbi:unnamed protein product [Jaminaea pallidilutea]